MKRRNLSRRTVVAALSASVVGTATSVSKVARAAQTKGGSKAQRRGAKSSPRRTAPTPAPLSTADKLVAPLAPGSRLDLWTVERVIATENGAASVIVSDASKQTFQLDICARDDSPGAAAAPGRSEYFEVFVANRGDGTTATVEDHGLVAMALADVIRSNEQHVDLSEYLTLAERLSAARVHV